MSIGKACAIFEQIDSKEYTEDEKLQAIEDVLFEMVTYNGITKDKILDAFKWFFKWCVEESTKPNTNSDSIRSMSDEELAELLDSVDNGGIRALDIDYPCDECTQKTKYDECFLEWLQSEVEE